MLDVDSFYAIEANEFFDRMRREARFHRIVDPSAVEYFAANAVNRLLYWRGLLLKLGAAHRDLLLPLMGSGHSRGFFQRHLYNYNDIFVGIDCINCRCQRLSDLGHLTLD
jgi:hypothetical protein